MKKFRMWVGIMLLLSFLLSFAISVQATEINARLTITRPEGESREECTFHRGDNIRVSINLNPQLHNKGAFLVVRIESRSGSSQIFETVNTTRRIPINRYSDYADLRIRVPHFYYPVNGAEHRIVAQIIPPPDIIVRNGFYRRPIIIP
jgi:hypothetical protein